MSVNDVYDYVDKLKSLMTMKKTVVSVSKDFNDIEENSSRIRFLQKLFDEYGVIIDGKLKMEKSNAIAESCRIKGNQSYANKEFLDALDSYNRCLCFAEPGSKLIALAYANRSAIYFEMKLYENCLKNLKLAMQNGYPTESIDKLKKREEISLSMINNNSNSSSRNVLLGAEYLKLTYKANEKLPFLADCLEIKNDKIFGRYIITKKALKPGDIICCEEPFSKIVLPTHRFKYCANCLNDNFLDLISCTGCTSTMFCSEDCALVGIEKFHKYECPIVDKLNSLCTKILRIASRTFFEALDVCNGNLEDLKALIEENRDSSKTIFDFDAPITRRNVLQAIDSLATNESERNRADLFQRSGIVAVVCDLFLTHTCLKDLLVNNEDQDFFRCFVFKQTQIAAINYHGLFNGVLHKSELESNSQSGSGSFPFCSLVNHSCAPNLVRVTAGCTNHMLVNRPIAAGEQLFDNYGLHHCLESFDVRQTSLKNQYMFNCSCEACEGRYPLYYHLKTLDRHFTQFVSDDIEKLSQLDIQRAKKKFQPYCDYLKKWDASYPCYEISSVQECLLRCFTIFTMTDFKMKLCGH